MLSLIVVKCLHSTHTAGEIKETLQFPNPMHMRDELSETEIILLNCIGWLQTD